MLAMDAKQLAIVLDAGVEAVIREPSYDPVERVVLLALRAMRDQAIKIARADNAPVRLHTGDIDTITVAGEVEMRAMWHDTLRNVGLLAS